jgi:hypothetical protein
MMATEWRARSDASPSMCTVPHPGIDAVLATTENGRVRAAMDVSKSMNGSVMANCEMSNPSMASWRTIYGIQVQARMSTGVSLSEVWSLSPQGLRPTCGGKALGRDVGSGARRGRSGDARGTRGRTARRASASVPEGARAGFARARSRGFVAAHARLRRAGSRREVRCNRRVTRARRALRLYSEGRARARSGQ